jgi:hypothetical protein
MVNQGIGLFSTEFLKTTILHCQRNWLWRLESRFVEQEAWLKMAASAEAEVRPFGKH